MATYSAVSASEKDADSPVNVGLLDKLDQNPVAMFEGAAGAPRLKAAALETAVSPGEHSCFYEYFSTNSDTNNAWTASGIFAIAVQDGTYRTKLMAARFNASTARCRIYRNGAAYGTERTAAQFVYTNWQEDLYFDAGDKIELYFRTDDSGVPSIRGWMEILTAAPYNLIKRIE